MKALSMINKRKIVPSKVAAPLAKRSLTSSAPFVADSLPTLAPAPVPTSLPEQNSNPAEEMPKFGFAMPPNTFAKVDIIATYPERIELAIPFADREVAKSAGCKWWAEERIWIAPKFEGFEDICNTYAGEYLCLRKEDHAEAKALGAIFRPLSMTWFGSVKGCGEKFGCIYFLKTKFEDKVLLKTEGCRWSPLFRCWYTSRQNFISNPALASFQ
jgi:hypothetical protein